MKISNLLRFTSLKFAFLLLAGISIIITSTGCENDPVGNGFVVLRHDGDNLTAPVLPGGATYEAAAKFTAGSLQNMIGDRLVEIDFFIQEIPSTCVVKVYTSNGGNSPVTEIYSSNVLASLSANSWNNHRLSTPYTITNEDIWIAVEFTHPSDARTVGCDPGPAVFNGDWIFDSSVGSWNPLSDVSTIDINWNIRGNVEPQ
ncbi:MAG: hypothetical protein AAF502_01310 [Bacteroidota bacterium]